VDFLDSSPSLRCGSELHFRSNDTATTRCLDPDGPTSIMHFTKGETQRGWSLPSNEESSFLTAFLTPTLSTPALPLGTPHVPSKNGLTVPVRLALEGII